MTKSNSAISPLALAMAKLDGLQHMGNHPELAGRAIRTMANSMFTKMVNIHEFRHLIDQLSPASMQRDHLGRILGGKVDYLTDLQKAHCAFALVWYEGKFWIVDGNHRAVLFFDKDSSHELPDTILLNVYLPDNQDDYNLLYRCFDSKMSKKTLQHDITSYYRTANVPPETFQSKLVRDGQWATIAKRLVTFRGLGRHSDENIEKIVHDYLPALRLLDAHMLAPRQIPGGAIWAVLLLYKQFGLMPKEVDNYLKEIILNASGNKSVSGAVKTAFLDAMDAAGNRLGYESAFKITMPIFYRGFEHYLKGLAKGKSKPERARLAGLVGQIPALPLLYG